jgi:uncharacterized cofD-like protein
MQGIPSLGSLSDLHKTASWKPDASRTSIEHLVEFILTGILASNAPPGIEELAEQVLQFDISNTHVVVLGGGTGLSTIIGGNSQMPDWPEQPWMGIKQEFPHLDIVVGTTDDGGSTGKLLKSLPLIGIGDIRKILLSSILSRNLQQTYDLDAARTHALVRTIHALFNYRFPEDSAPGFKSLENPLLVLPPALRSPCPRSLAVSLRELGKYISPKGQGPVIEPAGHSMGNLLMTSAIFMAARGRSNRSPGIHEIQKGIDRIAWLIGAPTGRIHAATATPGQLKVRYANGIEVYGQSKSSRILRDSPVAHVVTEFTGEPLISAAVQGAFESADLIIYAPGSLYTSIIPILQLDPITEAIRANKKALKILGANSWVQKGETDISLRNQGRGFLVSELIEACDRNVSLGINGLFDVVLSANLEHIPRYILRNYAIEGKSPIDLDRTRVEQLGLRPVEATLFSPEHEKKTPVIHHDARRFMLAIRTLLYADNCLGGKKGYSLRNLTSFRKQTDADRHGRNIDIIQQSPGRLLCDYLNSIKKALMHKEFEPPVLKDFLIELAWENREISPAHLKYFRGLTFVKPAAWDRNNEWDNILGYYDPQDQFIKLHEDLFTVPSKIKEDLLVALGESLLGQYIGQRNWIEYHGARAYEIVLRPPSERHCLLTDTQLHTYLKLARMTQDKKNPLIYRITVNNDAGFLPPGLLFGLIFAWYLSGSGLTMEYEMSLLGWPIKSLMPLHVKDYSRKKALVTFFRTQIFHHSQ